MKKIGIMLIFLIFFSCFNDSKKQIKNNLNSDRANVTFTIKWPEKNIKSNSKITANILPETQKIDIFLIKTLEMENFNTQDLYYIEEFIPFLKKNASFQEIIRGSETVVTSEFKGLGIGEYYLFVFAYNENDELLNEVWDKIVLKEGTNQKNIIFGAPEKISYINLGDGFVDINSFSGIQFDSVESNFNSINVSPSFIDNNITYELYFGTNPSSLVKQLNTKNSTSAGIIIEFKYPEDFTPEYKDLENNTTYYYRIDASNEETKKYNTFVSSICRKIFYTP